MPFKTIWERYFLREMFKVFALFLICFYGLYVLIDYSTHSRSFHNYHFTFANIISFYAYEFVTRMDALIPFAILIACIKTLYALNVNNELVALMASGIKLKRLLFPFLAFGLFFTALIFFNTEVLQPRALKYHKQIEQTRAKAKQNKHRHPHIQQITLEDNTSLVFQAYDEATQRFIDAYWIRSIDDIYRIGTLSPYHTPPLGSAVEHIQRNAEGALTVVNFATEKTFSDMQFNPVKLLDTVSSPEDYPLSALREKLPTGGHIMSEKEAKMLTTYYYKLALPWFCLLAIIAPAPFCTRFSRSQPIFFIYALSIFGLVSVYLLMDAAVILGERQVVSPALAIWLPFTCCFSYFGWRFARL